MPGELSEKQIAIVVLINCDLTYKQIADVLGLSFAHVRNQVKGAMEKTGTHSKVALCGFVFRKDRMFPQAGKKVRKGVPTRR